MEFRLYLCPTVKHGKTSGARGVFICSRLLTLVVERSVNPLTASLLITIAFKLSFEAVGFPAIHPILQQQAIYCSFNYVIAGALYPLPLFVSKEFRLYHRFVNKTPGARGLFTCSRLLNLVVERSFSPENASLLIGH